MKEKISETRELGQEFTQTKTTDLTPCVINIMTNVRSSARIAAVCSPGNEWTYQHGHHSALRGNCKVGFVLT